MVDKNRVYTKVTNAIYDYLSKNADFNTPIYLSNLIDIIEDFSEVNHADIRFEPIVSETANYIFSTNTGMEFEDISATFQNAPIGHVFFQIFQLVINVELENFLHLQLAHVEIYIERVLIIFFQHIQKT